MLYTPLFIQSRTACLQRGATKTLTIISPARSFPQSSPQTVTRSQFATINNIKGFNSFLLPRPSSLTLKSRSLLRYRKLYQVTGLAGLGLSLSLLTAPVYCEPVPPNTSNEVPTPPTRSLEDLPPAPKSSVSLYELSFGTTAGICAGVFVKKGAKMAAFVFGGVFVLLQYLGSLNMVRVNWTKIGQRFENLFYIVDAQGARRAPNVGSLLRWLVDFLTSDFQPRASFIAGFALGLRIG